MATPLPAVLEVETRSATEVVDITSRVDALIAGAPEGSCLLYLRHTTAGLMVVTNEEGAPADMMDILQTLTPPLAFRYARPDDSFVDMADLAEGAGEPDPPRAGEVVYADAANVLCRRWNWRQDARSLIRPHTSRAIITVQAHGWGDLEAALQDLADLVREFCDGNCRLAIADAARRTVEV